MSYISIERSHYTPSLLPLKTKQNLSAIKCGTPCMNQGPNSTTGVCESCPPGCDFCSGPAPYQCLTCNSATTQGWNGTRCVLNCDSACSDCYGFSHDECTVCQPSYYTYQNGSCLTKCDYPFLLTQENGLKQCKRPCSNPQDYYYTVDKICKTACPSPFQSQTFDNIKVCWSTTGVNIEEAQQVQAAVSSITKQGKATGTSMKVTSAFSSSNPGLALLAGLASMLSYIKYINLNYPAKLKLTFQLQDSSPFSFTFGIGMPKSLEKRLESKPLPGIFEGYKLHSNFLHNYWDTLTSLIVVLLLILILSMMKVFTKKCSRINRVLASILSILKWNLPLMILCGGFGDIYFYASLYYQSKALDSPLEIFTFALSLLLILLGVGILFLIFLIMKDTSKDSPKRKWQSFTLLFENYEKNSLYMMLFLTRTIIFNLVIANLFDYPLLQTVLILILGILMLAYLVIKRPLKELLELIQLFLNEILLMVVNISVFIIAIMDHLGIQESERRNQIGEVINSISFIFTALSLLFVALQILLFLYSFFKFIKRLKNQGPLTFSRIIQALFNQEDKPHEMNQTSFAIQTNQETSMQTFERPPKDTLSMSNMSLNHSHIFETLNHEFHSPKRKSRIPKSKPRQNNSFERVPRNYQGGTSGLQTRNKIEQNQSSALRLEQKGKRVRSLQRPKRPQRNHHAFNENLHTPNPNTAQKRSNVEEISDLDYSRRPYRIPRSKTRQNQGFAWGGDNQECWMITLDPPSTILHQNKNVDDQQRMTLQNRRKR